MIDEASLTIIGRHPPAIVGKPDTKILSMIMGFARRSVRHAPIVDNGGNVVGIVTERDIVKKLPRSVA